MAEQVWERELLDSIWQERMTLCYKMLLVCELMEGADSDGQIRLGELARRFQQFFRERRASGKAEDNPNFFRHGERVLSDRSIEEWERNIVEEPLAHMKNLPIEHVAAFVRGDPSRWGKWSNGFKSAIKKTAEVRLIEYFEKHVPGGF